MIRSHRSRHVCDERGSASVELVILAPLVALLLAGVVAVGRVQHARADVEAAAAMAARELAMSRDPASRLGAAQAIAAATLDTDGPSCTAVGFHAAIGETTVVVSVSCTVSVQDAALLPLPGSMTVTATASEVRDEWRETP